MIQEIQLRIPDELFYSCSQLDILFTCPSSSAWMIVAEYYTCSIEHIPEDQRTYEDRLRARSTELAPIILGGLFDALSTALRNLDTIIIPRPPRLADFARLITAAEPALPWAAGRFMQAYHRNRMAVHRDGVGDPVCFALMRLLSVTGYIQSISATDLLISVR